MYLFPGAIHARGSLGISWNIFDPGQFWEYVVQSLDTTLFPSNVVIIYNNSFVGNSKHCISDINPLAHRRSIL